MKIARRWNCPNCKKQYYIKPNSNDECDIVECVQIAGFALRHCERCGYVMTIRPRKEDETQR